MNVNKNRKIFQCTLEVTNELILKIKVFIKMSTSLFYSIIANIAVTLVCKINLDLFISYI